MFFKDNETIYIKFTEATNYFNQLLSNSSDISVLKKLEEVSDKNIWARIRLAECTLNGIIKDPKKNDVKKAFKILDKLAKQGVIFAKFKKAQYILEKKTNTEEQLKKAEKILLELPNQYEEDAQYILGCYYLGKEAKKKKKKKMNKKAKKFLKNAAKLGNEAAKNKLDELNNNC